MLWVSFSVSYLFKVDVKEVLINSPGDDSSDEEHHHVAPPVGAPPPGGGYYDQSGPPPPAAPLPDETADGSSVSSSDKEDVEEAREDYAEAIADRSEEHTSELQSREN